ncbi:MAG: MFS transporter, partial [Acidobacteriales bacterium]|nr:MFS transporter [Terriglobales bacterium]
NIAQGWLVLQLTNSAFWLGVVSFAAAAPLLVFTVIGGVIADRLDRRRLLLMTPVALMVSALLWAALTWTERITVTHIVLLAFVSGVAASLSAPAQQALVPQLVPRADLTNAIGINSAQFNLSRVIGPTVGGFAMELFGMAGNFFLNGLSFLAVIIALRNMHCPATSPIDEGSLWSRLREGFRYVFTNPKMTVLLWLVVLVAFLGVPALSFVPLFARDMLGAGERGLGVLMAFSGIGAFLAAVLFAYMGRPKRRGIVISASGSAYFAAIAMFALSKNFALSCAMLFLAGFAAIILVAIVNVRLQHMADDEMRGRTMSIYAMAYLGLPPLGSLLAGYLTRWISAPHAIAPLAAGGFILLGITLVTQKELRQLD